MSIKRPRGTADVLPEEVDLWLFLEETARQICEEYDYREIRTPVFEHTELFHRGVGDTTDIVEKEMYDFQDKGGRSITLRPEGTAPVVRAYLENNLRADAQPVKLFYLESMFRYGRPQTGRLRQFHQFGIEAFGSKDPAVDAEVIGLCMDYYERLGLKDLELRINSVGCPECRQENRRQLQEFLDLRVNDLCNTCQGRFDRNPLRIFDCKGDTCQEAIAGAPTPADTLCPECEEHFQKVKDYLSLMEIPYLEDRRLVRGLDYYTNTAFEVVADCLGAQSSIGGGGRYDALVETVGGPATPGIGFGLGMERIILSLKAQGIKVPVKERAPVFVATLSGDQVETETKQALEILYLLRRNGMIADKDYMGRSLKAQMKHANKKGFKFAVIVGGEEMERSCVSLRNMETGVQEEVSKQQITEALLKLQGGNECE